MSIEKDEVIKHVIFEDESQIYTTSWNMKDYDYLPIFEDNEEEEET